MSKRLYVGNLPFHATEDLIQSTFAPCGDIAEVAVVLDRVTGRSRGFAFVEMTTPEGAQNAVAKLDGKDLGGRAMRVSIAEDRGRGGGGGGGGGRDRR